VLLRRVYLIADRAEYRRRQRSLRHPLLEGTHLASAKQLALILEVVHMYHKRRRAREHRVRQCTLDGG